MSDTVCLICTRDRPEFVLRALGSILQHGDVRVHVLDASTSVSAERLYRRFSFDNQESNRVEVKHFVPGESITARLTWALANSYEPYVYLAADDDLTLRGFCALQDVIRSDSNVVAAYGATFRFSLRQGFVPYGDLESFELQRPVPPIPWQDDSDLGRRLRSTSQGPLSSHGWYAIHKRTALTHILDVVNATGQADEVLEFALCLLQPIMGRITSVQEPALARQDLPVVRLSRPVSRKDYQSVRTKVLAAAEECLIQQYGISPMRSEGLIERLIRHDMDFAVQKPLSQSRAGGFLKALLDRVDPRVAICLSAGRAGQLRQASRVPPGFEAPTEQQVKVAHDLVKDFVHEP